MFVSINQFGIALPCFSFLVFTELNTRDCLLCLTILPSSSISFNLPLPYIDEGLVKLRGFMTSFFFISVKGDSSLYVEVGNDCWVRHVTL